MNNRRKRGTSRLSERPFRRRAGETEHTRDRLFFPSAETPEKGITTGVTATAFQPDRAIDRQQAMAILFCCSGGVSGMESLLTGVYDSQFKDSGDIAPALKPGVYWAVYPGVVGGVTQDTLAPGALPPGPRSR